MRVAREKIEQEAARKAKTSKKLKKKFDQEIAAKKKEEEEFLKLQETPFDPNESF